MIREGKKALIRINLSAVLSSLWQRHCRCRVAQLSLRQAQDGLLCCCALICSRPAPAPITSEYLVTLLQRSLGSAKNPNAGGVLKPPGKLGMQHQAPVFAARTLTAPQQPAILLGKCCLFLAHVCLNSVHFQKAPLFFGFVCCALLFLVWLVSLGFLFVCGLQFFLFWFGFGFVGFCVSFCLFGLVFFAKMAPRGHICWDCDFNNSIQCY